MTVMPGLIDVHTHITGEPNFDPYFELTQTDAKEAIQGVVNARTTLMAGFTTIRNVGAGGYTDVDLRDAINQGEVPGPHMQVSGPPLGITGGHCDENLLPVKYHVTGDGVADGIAGVQQKVRQNIKYGVDLIKICATGGVFRRVTIRRPRSTPSKRCAPSSPMRTGWGGRWLRTHMALRAYCGRVRRGSTRSNMAAISTMRRLPR